MDDEVEAEFTRADKVLLVLVSVLLVGLVPFVYFGSQQTTWDRGSAATPVVFSAGGTSQYLSLSVLVSHGTEVQQWWHRGDEFDLEKRGASTGSYAGTDTDMLDAIRLSHLDAAVIANAVQPGSFDWSGATLNDHVPHIPAYTSGPSAGLAFALAEADHLVDADLSAGLLIAATGTVAGDGTTGPVGGVRSKLQAAQAAGADVAFIGHHEPGAEPAPAETYLRAGKASRKNPNMAIVHVDRVVDVYAWICGRTGPGPACDAVETFGWDTGTPPSPEPAGD